MSDTHRVLAHHFEDLEQQRESASLGMWVFLLTEVMFFGGLFLGYALYRSHYPEAFIEGSRELDIVLGTANTAILICSSLTMVLAVHGAQKGNNRAIVLFLILTGILGSIFLGIKGVEYTTKIEHGLFPGPLFHFPGPLAQNVQMFFVMYFTMTGLHALHMILGIAVLIPLIFLARQGRFTPENHNTLENFGLYWHFVDMIWIFLFPLLYLLGRH